MRPRRERIRGFTVVSFVRLPECLIVERYGRSFGQFSMREYSAPSRPMTRVFKLNRPYDTTEIIKSI